MVMKGKVPFKRPVSVEHEERALERSRTRRHLYIGLILVAFGAWIGFGGRKLGGVVSAIKTRLGL